MMKRPFLSLSLIGTLALGCLVTFVNRPFLLAQVPQVERAVAPSSTIAPSVVPGPAVAPLAANPARVLLPTATPPGNTVPPGQQSASNVYFENLSYPTLPPDVARYAPHPAVVATNNVYYRYGSPDSLAEDQRLQGLLMEYQGTKEDAKRKEIVDQITVSVAKQFDEKQTVRAQELKQLEEKLAELKEKHKKRESLKEKIVRDRVEQLVNNIEGLGWGMDPNPLPVSASAASPMALPEGTVNLLGPAAVRPPFGASAGTTVPSALRRDLAVPTLPEPGRTIDATGRTAPGSADSAGGGN